MDYILHPKKLLGTVAAIPSKSMAHRLLICAAFAQGETEIRCAATNQDIEATVQCLEALGAGIVRKEGSYFVTPGSRVPDQARLYCRESGSTLRFLLPIAGALGVKSLFYLEGRLPERPLSPLWEELERMGCCLSRPERDQILLTGKLRPGAYRIPGNISSQYITGLMFAQKLIGGPCSLEVTGSLESAPYLEMTRKALEILPPGEPSPGRADVEGDWSNAAFFLTAKALGSNLQVTGLNPDSCQGDRAVCGILPEFSAFAHILASDIPDLVPILAVAAAAGHGAVFTGIRRLRMKESDRVESVIQMITALGGRAFAQEDSLTVEGTGLLGGTVNSYGDHRIAMSAAIASTVCRGPVIVLGADCVRKSYPDFWADFARLGGSYEQYLR